MQLTKTITRLLKNIANMAKSGGEEFDALTTELELLEKRLSEPLRVAVVGIMKAGKSTLMNAILKEKVLFTGTLETTYTVTWFKYGEEKRLNIIFKDGSEQSAPYEDLEKWTVRPKNTETSEIDKVAHVVVYYPNEILKKMELIDTPGLESTHGTDSQNTLDFLGKRLAKEADEATAKTASQAEAVIYAFSRGVQDTDSEMLDTFRNDTSGATPINAIGIFTKTDMYWNCTGMPDANPLVTVREACEGYQKRLKDKLYKIFPVVAKPVETVSDMNKETFDIMSRLAEIDAKKLTRRLADAYDFANLPTDSVMTVSPKDRAHVLDLYGQYGIYAVTQAIRDGITYEALADYMYDKSGVAEAARVIFRHFGNRAYLIKTEFILRSLRALASTIKQQNPQKQHVIRVCDRVTDDIDKLRDEEQAFKELAVLQSYYNDEFALSDDDEKQFFEIMCEHGSYCEARLGFDEVTPITEMKNRALERVRHWSELMNDYNTSHKVNDAAEIVVRSCENMYYHLDMLSGYDD